MEKRIAARDIRLKPLHRPASAGDGARILIDRLWPRGVSKCNAAIDLWARDMSPSPALRQWFGDDPVRWPEFHRRYAAELRGRPDQLAALRAMARRGLVTLVFATADELRNDAAVLRGVLLGR